MVIEINVLKVLSWIVACIIFYLLTRVAQFEKRVSWAAYITLAFSSVYGFANAIQTIIEKFS
jgi:hypothetical protein